VDEILLQTTVQAKLGTICKLVFFLLRQTVTCTRQCGFSHANQWSRGASKKCCWLSLKPVLWFAPLRDEALAIDSEEGSSGIEGVGAARASEQMSFTQSMRGIK
jgi:hypothetical protein